MLYDLDNAVVNSYAHSIKERKAQLIAAVLECLDMDDTEDNLRELDSYLTDYVLLDLAYIKLVDIYSSID